MSERREVLFLSLKGVVKDPIRSNGAADCSKQFSAEDHDKNQRVRRIWFESGMFFIEALCGPHKGQLIATPSTNCDWARFADGEELRSKKAPQQNQQKKAG